MATRGFPPIPDAPEGAAARRLACQRGEEPAAVCRPPDHPPRATEGSGPSPVIPLKGAFLAEAVYGDIALRPMADFDLLVKPPDLPRAVEILRQLGYESEQPFDPAAQRAGFQDMPPMRRPGGAVVELHWTLVTPLCGARIDERELAGIGDRLGRPPPSRACRRARWRPKTCSCICADARLGASSLRRCRPEVLRRYGRGRPAL